MSECEFAQLLSEYLNHELNKSKHEEVAEHYRHCHSCAERLKELKTVHRILAQHNRPAPPKALLKDYQNYLRLSFKANPRNFILRPVFGFRNLFVSRPLTLRIVPAAVILIIAMILGKVVFDSFSVNTKSVVEANRENISEGDLRLVQNFLLTSEMWLLEIVNSKKNQMVENGELILRKKVAQKLLMQTFVIHQMALQLKDERTLNFLTHLEMLLFEVENSDEEQMSNLLSDLTPIIKEKKLLNKNRELRSKFKTI